MKLKNEPAPFLWERSKIYYLMAELLNCWAIHHAHSKMALVGLVCCSKTNQIEFLELSRGKRVLAGRQMLQILFDSGCATSVPQFSDLNALCY